MLTQKIEYSNHPKVSRSSRVVPEKSIGAYVSMMLFNAGLKPWLCFSVIFFLLWKWLRIGLGHWEIDWRVIVSHLLQEKKPQKNWSWKIMVKALGPCPLGIDTHPSWIYRITMSSFIAKYYKPEFRDLVLSWNIDYRHQSLRTMPTSDIHFLMSSLLYRNYDAFYFGIKDLYLSPNVFSSDRLYSLFYLFMEKNIDVEHQCLMNTHLMEMMLESGLEWRRLSFNWRIENCSELYQTFPLWASWLERYLMCKETSTTHQTKTSQRRKM